MLILTIIVVTFCYAFSILYKRKKLTDYLLANFPSPPTDPIVGHVLRFPRSPPEILKHFTSWFEKYGKNVVMVRPFYENTVIISNPRDIEVILTNPNSKLAKKADDYLNLEPWLGTGLLLSDGEKWFQRRKIITPTFHFNILESFVEVMGKQSDVLVEKLKPKVEKGDIDIYMYTTLFALDVICETSMGISVDAQSTPNSQYVKAVKEMTILFQKRFLSLFGRLTLIYDLTPDGRYEKKLRQILHDFTDKVIVQRRDQLLKQNPIEQNEKIRMNFLDMLLKATINGKSLSNADIREEVDTFMFEGHDTTTSGIAFTLHLLSQHKDIQDRLYEELIRILGDIDTMNVTYTKLADLRYLDMVVKESLRLRPPVPFIGRQLTEETILGGVKLPAGLNVNLAINRVHWDPENFPDPNKFDPERFNPAQISSSTSRHQFAYVPFSAGARNCIGQKFALMEVKLVVAKLLMNYELLPAIYQKEPQLQSDVVLKSADGIRLRIANRKR